MGKWFCYKLKTTDLDEIFDIIYYLLIVIINIIFFDFLILKF